MFHGREMKALKFYLRNEKHGRLSARYIGDFVDQANHY